MSGKKMYPLMLSAVLLLLLSLSGCGRPEANMETLRARGVHFVGPVVGHLACGDSAIGKMAEPEDIIAAAAAIPVTA